MNLPLRSFFITMFGFCASLSGQDGVTVDTLPTPSTLTHLSLNIEIPKGDIFIKPSPVCGQSFNKLAGAKPGVYHDTQEKRDPNGNLVREISLGQNHKGTGSVRSVAPPRMAGRITRELTNLDSYATSREHTSEIEVDPNVPTNLYVDLGVGSSHLDLSALTLKNVSINSGLSDVVVVYTSRNKVRMSNMDVHTIKADLTLKNLEYAQADLVNIQNDMGDTKVILGNGCKSSQNSNIVIQSGVGKCTLIIHDQHPTKIHLRNGFFSTTDISEGFIAVGKGIYANEAFHHREEGATHIICNIDFGSISIMEVK